MPLTPTNRLSADEPNAYKWVSVVDPVLELTMSNVPRADNGGTVRTYK